MDHTAGKDFRGGFRQSSHMIEQERSRQRHSSQINRATATDHWQHRCNYQDQREADNLCKREAGIAIEMRQHPVAGPGIVVTVHQRDCQEVRELPKDGDLLPAIMTMNDLLKRYPKDEHVLYLTSEWLYFQQDYDRARQMLEITLQIDPNFPPALNMLGFAYLEAGNPDPTKAIAALKRYVELQPGQPSPEDSLGKVLRYAGDDQGSVEHYGEALQLDPTFIAARVGLADTLTLMDDYSNARDQYDRAISVAESSRDRYHAEYQKALVFFWEGHLVDGRKLLEDLAAKARAEKEPYAQFEIGFARALLATNAVDEFAQLKFLESFLQGPVAGMTEADRNVSLGAVWRERARAYASSGESDAADQAVHQLEELAAHTRDMVIENTYESAYGYALFAQGEVADAADELVTDIHNPLVLRQFILAQQKLGNSAGAEASRTRLKYLRGSTVEWFLVSGSASSKAH